ncbi:amino acid ABC transporter substrate-binding protein [Pararhodobacter aggregans]|uniref:Amino acid ABC transporter substrate-binding protein n=1 Tax=Pararhodobacter aggregans TaxID=404875 RepID=A0A2T7UK65_9RHOB|nr:amino acid ABC transporter substrate-binding protein [Pararhodobacter aggregans]PTX03239.1 general L-amino acid transport system substrate-binding protein [Pararhodobacter aggregans]PVE45082.1 amino acid ABC transporter substrate-binding protein [Pararhodobacter aggregans]
MPLKTGTFTLAAALTGATAMLSAGAATAQQASPTLDAVRARGEVACGVIGSSFGFSLPDSQGVMQGMDADSCRAVAAAVLGDANAVRWVPLVPAQRLTALQTGEIDVLYAQLTWTMSRETDSGVQMASTNYFDGTGFLVPTSLGVASATELDGANVCSIQGPGEVTARDYFTSQGMSFTPVLFAEGEELRAAFLAGRCDVYMIDQSALISFRASLGDNAANYTVLPEIISAEPLSGAVRKGDPLWFDIVRYAHIAQVNAENLGITAENVDSFGAESSPAIRRFLGMDGTLGQALGLQSSWAHDIVAQVGNYGEMWQRHFGRTGADRGANRLARDGGLQYPYPMR